MDLLVPTTQNLVSVKLNVIKKLKLLCTAYLDEVTVFFFSVSFLSFLFISLLPVSCASLEKNTKYQQF